MGGVWSCEGGGCLHCIVPISQLSSVTTGQLQCVSDPALHGGTFSLGRTGWRVGMRTRGKLPWKKQDRVPGILEDRWLPWPQPMGMKRMSC